MCIICGCRCKDVFDSSWLSSIIPGFQLFGFLANFWYVCSVLIGFLSIDIFLIFKLFYGALRSQTMVVILVLVCIMLI